MIEPLEMIYLLTFGFAFGMKHSLEPDHIAAVSSMISESKSIRTSAKISFLWGLGHTVTLLLVGTLVLMFKWAIPTALSNWFQLLVSILLVFFGIVVLVRASHDSPHKHRQIIPINKVISNPLGQAFCFGMVHGMAGSASLLLLVVAAAENVFTGSLFIVLFGIGSIVGMVLVGFLMGIPIKYSSRKRTFNIAIKVIAGLLSILLGILMMHDLFMNHHLFS